MEPSWLDWARRLNALAQTGLTFAENPYDIERYTTIRTIAAEMVAHGSGGDTSRVLDLFACDAGYATPKVSVRRVPLDEPLTFVSLQPVPHVLNEHLGCDSEAGVVHVLG